MDFNKPWGWQQPKAVAPMGNSVAPLASSAASMPESTVLPESLGKRMTRDVGSAVAMKALDNAMKPAADLGSVAQDSATKAALFSDVGYGAPMGAAAGEAATEAAGEAATDVAADAATDAATDVAADTATSGMAAAVPLAGALKSFAEGDYLAAAAQAAGTTVAGTLGGLAAKYATQYLPKVFGLADGTTSVPAPMSSADRSAARMAAGTRYAPELFRSVNAPAVNAANPIGAAIAGGKGGATAPVVATQPAHSIVTPVAAPAKTQLPFFRQFFNPNPAWENAEVGGA